MTCYLRSLGRNNHVVLANSDPNLNCRVLFGFFNSFLNQSFDNKFKSKYGIDQYLELDLTSHNPDIQLPLNLVKACNDCLLKSQ